MSEVTYYTTVELLKKANEALGKRIGEFDQDGKLQKLANKGDLGQIIQVGHFGCKINSRQAPDFENLGIELKVAPYKWVYKNKQVSAKERISLTQINYKEDYDTKFEESHCYHKLEKILLMFYEHEADKNKYDYIISKIFLYQFNLLDVKDQQIIINDYYTILNKIKAGEAHLISEGDTFYLGACTKGQTAEKSMGSQPFSEEPARKRAFSLKASYMTNLLRNYIFEKHITRDSFIKDISVLKTKSLKDIIEDTLGVYRGLTLSELDSMLGISINRKSYNYLRSYISRMLNSSSDNAENLDEFLKANIKIKTIRVMKNGRVKESMSFPAFKFKQLIKEEWENSSLREQFISDKYLLCIFDEVNDIGKEYKFRNAILWSMPERDIDTQVAYIWGKTKETIIKGVQLTVSYNSKNQIRVKNNLPKASEKKIIHVRPHTNNAVYRLENGEILGKGKINTDGDILPDGRVMTKQCFFINNSYIMDIIKDIK